MIDQILLGSLLILISCVLAGLMWWALEAVLTRCSAWLARPPYGRRIAAGMVLALGWSILLLTVNVWMWAAAFRMIGVFDAMEPAVYFALVAFTTLGFGDILLPEAWRLLGGLAAANGLLTFGLLTALLLETLRGVRRLQREGGFLET